MKVLFDHNVPRQLRTGMGQHLVLTARELGWDLLENGNLIAVAERDSFEVFLTTDKDFFAHQDKAARSIAIVFVTTNHLPSLEAARDRIQQAIQSSVKGSFRIVQVDLLRPDKKVRRQQPLGPRAAARNVTK